MKTDRIRGNPEALRRFRARSLHSTQKRLMDAIQRIRAGRTEIVRPGTRLSVEAIAEEAAVHRATIYRYHPEIITQIRCKKTSEMETTNARNGKVSAELEERLRKANEKIRNLEEQLVKALRENHLLQRTLQEKSMKAAGNVVALNA